MVCGAKPGSYLAEVDAGMARLRDSRAAAHGHRSQPSAGGHAQKIAHALQGLECAGRAVVAGLDEEPGR